MSEEKKEESELEMSTSSPEAEAEKVKDSSEAESTTDEKNDSEGSRASEEQHEKQPKKSGLWSYREVRVGAYFAAAIVVLGILFGTHVLCAHEWKKATCTAPKTCLICGKTQGEELGHKWLAATCTEPEVCERCGKEEGEPLGHAWKKATCTEPETCGRCLETRGSALGHDIADWKVTKEATCTETGEREGVCKRCGETIKQETQKKEHTPGDWEIQQDYTISSDDYVTPGVKVQKCKVCGQVLNQQEYTVELTISQSNALAKAASYLDYTSFSYKSLINQLEFEGFSSEDATFAVDHCGADWMVQAEKKARQYMDYSSFSRASLIGQLEFEGFTAEQAAHGADSVGL